jgi:hypothetical protein
MRLEAMVLASLDLPMVALMLGFLLYKVGSDSSRRTHARHLKEAFRLMDLAF